MTSLLGRLAVDTRSASSTIATVACVYLHVVACIIHHLPRPILPTNVMPNNHPALAEVSSSAVHVRVGAEEPLATFCAALGEQVCARGFQVVRGFIDHNCNTARPAGH